MADPRRVDLDEIVLHFHELEDPRSSINLQHPLTSVIAIALMAILAGAAGPTAIARWAVMKEAFLVRVLDLPNGIPRKDVFRRVLMALKPDAFQSCFAGWLRSLRATAEAETGIEQPVLAVDGKTARRSHDRKNGLGALHSVSVWASEYGLSLGQVACAEKSNEITAIPELLRQVDIEGAIITIDAMGTQKAIAERIVEGKADYVLALKGNQGTMHQVVINHILEQWEDDFAGVDAGRHQTVESGHGRRETRTYIQLPVPQDLPGLRSWNGLKSIGIAVSESVRDGKETDEVRYYISSLTVDVQRFARAVRSHWGIENGCHWSLDVTYREDESRIREKCLRENMAWLNRLSLSLLKQHPGRESVAMKRRSCGWSEEFLLQVIVGSTN
ncbi:ISAs1 family transposase [Singulisphaera acidiphila]|uniref:Transposase n=2 Tax=Singulisphaera acidiphila TaxID=466153 RepID=L0DND9_SINAD|nr:ISAs1 family transposase [Singulisphaera acidiphila]AGA30345.1 transposase [Singulisphaera acidiphila DSM 18658]